jgi:hypothetical protein
MVCPLYQEEGPHCRCRAVRGEHIPTLHEREKHCTSSHETCPVFLTRVRAGRRLRDDEYLAAWGAAVTTADR